MQEKESPKKEEITPVRSANFSPRIFGIIKFLLGVLVLPFVYASTRAFLNEFSLLEEHMRVYFSAGVISFLVFYLFVWEPVIFYKRGQQFTQVIFRFFLPLVKVAPYVLPIYTLIFFILLVLTASFYKRADLADYFVFLIGFSISLHLVFSARSLKGRQSDYLRANYLFGFSFIYIINIFLLSFGFNLLFDNYSFVNFFNSSFQIATEIFKAIFGQLFL